MEKEYDYLIVGAGLFGCVCADLLSRKGYSILLIDKNDFIGGTCYTELIDGIVVHRFGAHIFRTNNKSVWNYINKFAEFNNFINSPLAVYKHEIYNLPFNMNTFSKLWGVITPKEAKEKIIAEVEAAHLDSISNLRDWAISQVGTTIFHKLIEGYTEKQWGRKCSDLPPEIMRRIPVRFTYDNNYYDSLYQGVPIGGYTPLLEKMVSKSDVVLGTDYLLKRSSFAQKAKNLIFTGPIDEFFDYCYGALEYRGLRFETQEYPEEDAQGNAVINYTEKEVPYTRIIEHKHFEFGKQKFTILTKEFPSSWSRGDYPFYPINNSENNAVAEKYFAKAKNQKNTFFGGRLGSYQYLDMQDTILAAAKLVGALTASEPAGLLE